MTATSLDELKATLEARSTEDLVAILRERDEEEWKPEVFEIAGSILASRGVEPPTEGVGSRVGINVVEDQPLVTLASYFSPAEAFVARAALESAGLEAWVADESTGTTYGVAVGTRLRVREEDEQSARELLEAFEEAPGVLPPELAAPPCPKCGAMGASQTSELMMGPGASGGTFGLRRDWYYDCVACHHRWADSAR